MGAEARLYKKLKNVSKDIVWTRIENQSLFGTPDLLGYNSKCTFFTVELKVANGNKVRLSPHQVSFHFLHPKNSFVLVEWKDKHLLFEGKQSLALVDSPLSSLEPVVDSLEDCVKYLSSL
jgi:Holliday junction resolvase